MNQHPKDVYVGIMPPRPYKIPDRRLDLEYARVEEDTDVLLIYKLTIQANEVYVPNIKWELYFTDIPTVEKLYWLLRATPLIVKQFVTDSVGCQNEHFRSKIKLKSLIKRYHKLVIRPTPSDYETYVTGTFYVGQSFDAEEAVETTLTYFKNKIIRELAALLNHRLRRMTQLEITRNITRLLKSVNEFFKFLRKNCEDFFIFLRMLRDLTVYATIREKSVPLYDLEKEQLDMMLQSIKTSFKNAFSLLKESDFIEIHSLAIRRAIDFVGE